MCLGMTSRGVEISRPSRCICVVMAGNTPVQMKDEALCIQPVKLADEESAVVAGSRSRAEKMLNPPTSAAACRDLPSYKSPTIRIMGLTVQRTPRRSTIYYRMKTQLTTALNNLSPVGIKRVRAANDGRWRTWISRCLILRCIGWSSLILGASSAQAVDAGVSVSLDMPPRLQWDANYGYCGEVSLISAGLFFGQYCSQYQARALASPRLAQNDINSQLLLGVNAARAASGMRLQANKWNTAAQSTTGQFLVWVKQQVLQGHPVMMGLLMNQYHFYGDPDVTAGDSDYDHIVPVNGIVSLSPLLPTSGVYTATDTLYYSDNGLWAPTSVPPFAFSSMFGSFAATRMVANDPRSPVYSLNSNCRNYGMAITGVKDHYHDTLPVRLSTSVTSETPAIRKGSARAPAPRQLTVKATVQIIDQTTACNLYLYSSFASVPDSNFNAQAAKASRVWRIPARSGAFYSVSLRILSNQVAVFRAVHAGAP